MNYDAGEFEVDLIARVPIQRKSFWSRATDYVVSVCLGRSGIGPKDEVPKGKIGAITVTFDTEAPPAFLEKGRKFHVLFEDENECELHT